MRDFDAYMRNRKTDQVQPVGVEWLRRGDYSFDEFNRMVENWIHEKFDFDDPVTEYFFDLCHDVWNKPDSENVCPHCNANLNAEPIPLKHRHMFGMQKYFSRKIGIYDMYKDRTVEHMCPDCEKRWAR